MYQTKQWTLCPEASCEIPNHLFGLTMLAPDILLNIDPDFPGLPKPRNLIIAQTPLPLSMMPDSSAAHFGMLVLEKQGRFPGRLPVGLLSILVSQEGLCLVHEVQHHAQGFCLQPNAG